eukprot:SAG31_NODE_6405_length_2031_cov_1.337992_1_plen_314_part_10
MKQLDISSNDGIHGMTRWTRQSAAALAKALPASVIEHIVIGPKATAVPVHGPSTHATGLDFSKQDLGLAESLLIAGALEANNVSSISMFDISSNPNFVGDVDQYGVLTPDTNITQFSRIFMALHMASIKCLILNGIGMGSKAASIVVNAILDSKQMRTSVDLIDLSDNPIILNDGVPQYSMATSTLFGPLCLLAFERERTINLSNVNMGARATQVFANQLLSTFDKISHPKQSSLNLLRNPLGSRPLRALTAAVMRTSIESIIGTKKGQGQVNLSNSSLGSFDAEIIAADINLSRATAKASHIDVHCNSLLGWD